jgi:hypothetical protein
MKENLEKELNSAVADLEKRRAESRQAANEKTERGQQLRKKLKEALQATALPALREVIESLAKQNILAEVEGPSLRSLTAATGKGPTLEFSFRTAAQPAPGRPAGVLAFFGDEKGNILNLCQGPPSDSSWGVVDTVAVDDLTAEWIQQRTIEAVVRVLKRLS